MQTVLNCAAYIFEFASAPAPASRRHYWQPRCGLLTIKEPRTGISRILYSTIILLGHELPHGSSTLPVNSADRFSVHLHGLAPRRVYLVSLRTFSFPKAIHTFCCTCPRLTADGRYPLRYPVVSGLSSPLRRR